VEHSACGRQAQATRAAHEQRLADRLFERLDLLADRRLRDAQLVGRQREVQPPCGRLEAAQGVK
jgi:hypothetical protein